MTQSIFLLEDDEHYTALLEGRIEDVGCVAVSYSTIFDAKQGFARTGDVYRAYFLDMKTPVYPGAEPVYNAGLSLREKLIEGGVDETKIYLMSAGVSHNDRLAAQEYHVDPSQIMGKDRFTERMLRQLLNLERS